MDFEWFRKMIAKEFLAYLTTQSSTSKKNWFLVVIEYATTLGISRDETWEIINNTELELSQRIEIHHSFVEKWADKCSQQNKNGKYRYEEDSTFEQCLYYFLRKPWEEGYSFAKRCNLDEFYLNLFTLPK